MKRAVIGDRRIGPDFILRREEALSSREAALLLRCACSSSGPCWDVRDLTMPSFKCAAVDLSCLSEQTLSCRHIQKCRQKNVSKFETTREGAKIYPPQTPPGSSSYGGRLLKT